MLYTKRLRINKDEYKTFYVSIEDLKRKVGLELIPNYDHESIPTKEYAEVILAIIVRGFSTTHSLKQLSMFNNEFKSVRLRSYFDQELLDDLIQDVRCHIGKLMSEMSSYNSFEFPVYYWFLNSSMVLIKMHKADIEEVNDDE